MAKEVCSKLKNDLPIIFDGKTFEMKTGYVLSWRYVLNLKNAGKIPGECFLRSGQRVVVVRDPFLEWLEARLEASKGGK